MAHCVCLHLKQQWHTNNAKVEGEEGVKISVAINNITLVNRIQTCNNYYLVLPLNNIALKVHITVLGEIIIRQFPYIVFLSIINMKSNTCKLLLLLIECRNIA